MKKYKTPQYNRMGGSSVQGEISATYKQLVRKFGAPTRVEPLDAVGEKTAYEWHLQADDGTFVWLTDPSKASPLYEPEFFGLSEDVERIPRKVMDKYRASNREWEVGGTSRRAVQLVRDALAAKKPAKKPAKKKAKKKAAKKRSTAKKRTSRGATKEPKKRMTLREQMACASRCLGECRRR